MTSGFSRRGTVAITSGGHTATGMEDARVGDHRCRERIEGKEKTRGEGPKEEVARVEALPQWLGIGSETRLSPEELAMSRSPFRSP